MTNEEIWSDVCDFCRERISSVSFNVWLDRLRLVKLTDSKAVISSPSAHHRETIMTNYSELLSDALRYACGKSTSFEIRTESELEAENRPKPIESFDFSFDNFIVGESNKFAYAAAKAVAENPGGAYNPLFIYGGSGLGKTHLINAIMNDIKLRFPDKIIVITKGDEFASELIEAIRLNTTPEFKAKYRTADVLLVDDIQFISGKLSTQEEFFHTYNTLYQDKKQIVMTSDRPPKELLSLEDRLRNRFEWGLLADVSIPSFETRVAIIKKKAEDLNLDLSEDISSFIANKIKTNIRQLEGTVRKLNAYYMLEGKIPSISLAQRAIGDIFSDNQPTPVTVERIINEVARTFEVTAEDICSSKRSAKISTARQTAIYVVREITEMSLASIGEEFDGRDHSSIIYAINKAQENITKNPTYKRTVDDIINNIRGE